ncbi:class I adenylate-forming enzyme family protein [Streptomyces sp. BE20]|uniref:class I adenylate-forming enzyme family protein n=1 Tax=Streptomyces sp. BE20 TaxID=3002525 RepID=UPI002E76EB28|nr:class I adenylate-forming enzyme family protein [Streptomyces sp. BE20]MEE1828235.1 class I adenylate-forming enzyme family protein [Streptomyces sp. BE20]
MLDRLAHALRTVHPDRPAVLQHTRLGTTRVRIRRGELADLSDTYATALHARGLTEGATLGVAVRPGPRALAVMLAAHRLGLRIAVLDPAAGPDVLAARLALAQPDLVLADAAAQAVAGWAEPLARRAGLALPPLDVIGPVATLGRRLPGCAPGLRLGRFGASVPRVPGRDTYERDADAVIVFTSGTTARPRAVVHTRHGLAAGLRTVTDLVDPRPGTTVVGGTFFVLVPALTAGAAVALPARTPTALARQLARLAPAHTYLTPPQLRAALAVGARFTGRVWTGSAPADAALLRRVKQAGADRAWGVYALTELFPAAAVEEAEKSAFTGPGDLVGAPLPGVRTDLGPDGELLLTGPGARHRYLGEEPDPWVRTGDRGALDGNGRIVLGGRVKDMVLRRAENIYPGLYEPALHLPGVALAVLVGVPSGDGDERLVALVQPVPGTDPDRLRAALNAPLDRMGTARPDAVLFGEVPLTGRSRKPDRAAASAYCARELST